MEFELLPMVLLLEFLLQQGAIQDQDRLALFCKPLDMELGLNFLLPFLVRELFLVR